MKSASRNLSTISVLALLVAFGLAMTTTQAQNREKYLISAKAGGINLVSGNVTVAREGSERWRKLSLTDDLDSGDRVKTGAGGRVEVLLNPGSYLRVDENSEFELTDASLDDLRVELIKGSAVLEVSSADGVRPAIGIYTPQTNALIIKGGIYRFNLLAGDVTEIIVRKGHLLYGKGAANEVKSGRKVLVRRTGGEEVAKLEKKDKEQDFLDLWSKDRAKMLAQANQRLQRRTLMTAFNDFGWNDWNGWSRYGGLGLWVYSPSAGGYCFLPYGLRGWSSPYGHRYGNGYGYYGPVYGNNSGYPTTGNTGNGNNGGNNSGGGNNGGGNGNPPSSPPSQPSYQPPPSPPPSMPAPRNDAPIERPTREYTIQAGSPQ
jgi:hypothetical protein